MRDVFLKQNTDASCVAELENRMNTQVKHLVKQQDKLFRKALKLEIPAKSGIRKEFYKATARVMYEIVEIFGWQAWKKDTIARWKELNK